MTAEVSSRTIRIRRYAILLLTAALAAGAGVLASRSAAPTKHDQAPQPAVLVTVADASTRDVPIYLSGLGAVQASKTVTVHTQVDGKLQSVNFVEGTEVHAGDVLVQIEPQFYQAALNQAKAKKAQDDAQLTSALKDLERFQTLVAKNVETQQNLDHQVALAGQLRATIEADNAAIEAAQVQLDYTTIRAPNDGRMGIRLVDPGNIVHAADTGGIAVLTQIRPIDVVFTLPEKNLEKVRQALAQGTVPVQVFSDRDGGKPLATGTLVLVDNEIDQTTGTIKLKAAFSNEDDALWPGAFVHARIRIGAGKDSVVVPSAAIQRGPRGLFVWRVRPDGTAEARDVQTGATDGDVTVVERGVSSGDRVVVRGEYRLQDGVRVKSSDTPPREAGS
jgi:multidrug efflux system membrane fusion protein